ncbi:hypothetical protein Tco_1019735 [Tanacetum coccineum]|uniref:Reverse transcriptase/retrotransposon-derived protein RNase H-like domain-containing protein n=1 Tax=Tanacetum coccineum TaxID=301880 RepID=A0ABQ5FY10_9ASTR
MSGHYGLLPLLEERFIWKFNLPNCNRFGLTSSWTVSTKKCQTGASKIRSPRRRIVVLGFRVLVMIPAECDMFRVVVKIRTFHGTCCPKAGEPATRLLCRYELEDPEFVSPEIRSFQGLAGTTEDEAFQILEGETMQCPVLALPDDFVVYCVHQTGFGCVLMQRSKVIAYASRTVEEA